MKIVVYGLTITSSWGNGHATTYRSLLKALARRGHQVTFVEKDVEWYRSNRDLPKPPSAPSASTRTGPRAPLRSSPSCRRRRHRHRLLLPRRHRRHRTASRHRSTAAPALLRHRHPHHPGRAALPRPHRLPPRRPHPPLRCLPQLHRRPRPHRARNPLRLTARRPFLLLGRPRPLPPTPPSTPTSAAPSAISAPMPRPPAQAPRASSTTPPGSSPTRPSSSPAPSTPTPNCLGAQRPAHHPPFPARAPRLLLQLPFHPQPHPRRHGRRRLVPLRPPL